MIDIKKILKQYKLEINQFLDKHLPDESIYPEIIHKSMRYSIFAGGKRIRPVLTLITGNILNIPKDIILPIAAAIECIHTYSLVHDDLPAMDNDELRRGLPTSHIKFGEDIAILCGDALLTESFKLLTLIPDNLISSKQYQKLLLEITLSSGTMGMIGGQVMDIKSNDSNLSKELLKYIHKHKTAAMIRLSVAAPAIFTDLNVQKLDLINKYGLYLGLLFQITDDILDYNSDTQTLGKPAGSDEKNKKLTYISLYGYDKSKEIAMEYLNKIIDITNMLGNKFEIFKNLAEYIAVRIS